AGNACRLVEPSTIMRLSELWEMAAPRRNRCPEHSGRWRNLDQELHKAVASVSNRTVSRDPLPT
ncbi:hypothetical protein BGZ89_007342, partial [Linnemannia elongata]